MVEVIVDQTEWRIPLASILIIEDQPELQQLEQIVDHIKEDLNLELEFICASNFEKAREALESRLKTPEKEKPLLILLDLDIPYQDQKLKNGCGGYQLIRQYHEKFADSCWVLLTTDTIRSEKESYGEGTLFDNLYRLQPFDVISRDNLKDLEEIVRSVLTYSGLSGDKRALPGTMIQFDEYLYGFSNYKLYHEIRSAAEGTRSILLFGETGTGKMLTARLIHYYSQRWNGKFHILDGIMGASELEKFFFSSDSWGSDAPSLLSQIKGGTLYIPNFDQMEGTSREESFALLKKLLRSLKYQSYDMRIIGAISRSRKEFPEFKKLLPEIFDTMIPLDLPSLEERKDDIPVLVEVFLEQFNRKLKESQKKPKQLIDSLSIYRLLQLRGWQDGNITRLRMVVEAVLFKTPKLLITAEDFTAAFDTSAEQSVSEVIEALPATAKERSVKRKKISPVGVYKHDIGLSYSIEDQNRARALAEALHRHGVDVFFDEYERATLWGEDLVTYMSELYQSDVRYCVMLLSEHYAKKPPYEHRVASARALKGVHILPICLDKTKIPSHLETINPLDWNKETTESIADKVVQKLYGQPSPTPPANTSGTARKKRTKQMHFLGQQPGETIKTVVRRHWLFLASPTLPLIGSIAIFLFLWFWGRSTSPLFHILWMIFEVGTVFLIFCSAIYFYYRGLNRWWKEINIITDKRIITWSSNFSDVNRQETPVVNVQQIAVERESFLGALLNYGTVYVYVRDGELIMKNVPDPNSVLNDIQSAKKRLAAKKARQREQTVL